VSARSADRRAPASRVRICSSSHRRLSLVRSLRSFWTRWLLDSGDESNTPWRLVRHESASRVLVRSDQSARSPGFRP
jgi:hypothetical protein